MKKIGLFPALLFVVACTNNNSSTPTDDGGVVVPNNLSFSKPAIGPKLTKAQAQEIKNTFTAKKPMMMLPPGELIFPSKDMPPYEKAQKEQQLAMQDPNAYKLLLDIRKSCSKGHPSLNFDATFPADEVTAENPFDVLQKGDKVSYNASAGLAGSNCPVDLMGSFGMNAEVKSVDAQARTASASAGTGTKLTAVMKNPTYARLLGTRGIIVDAGISGLAVHREVVKGANDKALVSFKLAGTYLSLAADIPYSTTYTVLANKMGETESTMEVVSTTELTYPNFKASLVVHFVTSFDKQDKPQIEAYLNGRPVSEADLKDLFGENLPGSQGEQVAQGLLN